MNICGDHPSKPDNYWYCIREMDMGEHRMSGSFVYGASIIVALVMLVGCDSGLSMKDGQFRGYGMTFDVPEGFVDLAGHPEAANTADARQLRRLGGVVAMGEKGEKLHTLVSMLPIGPADRLDLDEALCQRVARDTVRRFEPRGRQLGISGRVEYSELASPGGIPDTECEFLVSMGGGEFFSLAIIFEYRETLFIAACEAESRDEAFRLCDDMFESWRRS